MLFYGLSEQRIRRVMKSPDRLEEGVAEQTSAVMQKSKQRKNPEEIWVMFMPKKKADRFQSKAGKVLMISAWRYPGISKPGNAIPIPQDILEELDINLNMIHNGESESLKAKRAQKR